MNFLGKINGQYSIGGIGVAGSIELKKRGCPKTDVPSKKDIKKLD
jgi:hypothetical protein